MRLPVSDLEVGFRLPDGHDDLAVLEAGGDSRSRVIERSLEVLCRLGKLNGKIADSSWLALTVTDFEHALLGLRRFLFGDTIRCLVHCACSERMEMEFSISTLLHAAQPRTPRQVRPSSTRTGWFLLPARDIAFRLPTVADQLAAIGSPSAYARLGQSCIEVTQAVGRSTATAERAMEAMAPIVSRPIAGICAACSAELTLHLHVPTLVLNELRTSSSRVHSEVHTIAATYHWQETAILALPQLRRQAYIEAIRYGGAR
jgi:hypothetical protein